MSNSITGAEVFEAGTWNGLTFTDDDLDGIVSSFNALKLAGRIPLKFGHMGEDARDGSPALGWVTKLYREGSKLMADIADIPDVVYKAIGKKLYKFVSIELLKNVKANTGFIPWVLDAVALLGATAPAVGTLKELEALTMARGSGLQGEACVTFSRDDGRQTQPNHRSDNHMAEDNTNAIKELSQQVAELSRRTVQLEEENSALKREKSDFSQTKQRLTDLQKQVEKDKVDARRKAIIDQLETAVKAEDILPAARERFIKVYKVQDDEVVVTITAEDVKEFIKENPNPKPKRAQKREIFTLRDPNADVPEGMAPDAEALMRARALLTSQGKHTFTHEELLNAAKTVLSSRPELAQAWKDLAEPKAA